MDPARFEAKLNLVHLRDIWEIVTMRKGRIHRRDSRERIERDCRIGTVGPLSDEIILSMRYSAK